MIKLGQAYLIKHDLMMYDAETGFSVCRNSDLIEEMGQVEFIFSDKTGTLTCNVMEFKMCQINGQVFKDSAAFQKVLDRTKFADEVEKQTTAQIHEFMRVLAVCHTVVMDVDKKTGKKTFQASSPDELALVDGAKQGGYIFAARNVNFIGIEVTYTKTKEVYEVLHEFPFDSTRKRMSLIVKKHGSSELIMMTKGADSIMLPRITLEDAVKNKIEEDLNFFALQGLRTLVISSKKIPAAAYKDWHARFFKISTSSDMDKEEQLDKIYDELEYGLTYLGSTAIEDLLQDEVPETIKHLMDAGIKIWVLTGDKQETAIEIGKSCNLIDTVHMDLVILSSSSKAEFEKKLKESFNDFVRKQNK